MYELSKPETCRRCGQATVRELVYGLPSAEVMRSAMRGEIALGGCIVTPKRADWNCSSCGYNWSVATDPERQRRIADEKALEEQWRRGRETDEAG